MESISDVYGIGFEFSIFLFCRKTWHKFCIKFSWIVFLRIVERRKYSAGVTAPREWFQFTKWRIYYIHAMTVEILTQPFDTLHLDLGILMGLFVCGFAGLRMEIVRLTCHRVSQVRSSLVRSRCHKIIPNPDGSASEKFETFLSTLLHRVSLPFVVSTRSPLNYYLFLCSKKSESGGREMYRCCIVEGGYRTLGSGEWRWSTSKIRGWIYLINKKYFMANSIRPKKRNRATAQNPFVIMRRTFMSGLTTDRQRARHCSMMWSGESYTFFKFSLALKLKMMDHFPMSVRICTSNIRATHFSGF